MKIKKNNSGLSLVEIIVVIFLLILFSFVLMNIFVTQGRLTTIGLKTSELQEERNQINREFNTAVRLADQIVPSYTIGVDTFDSGDTTMILRIPSLGADGKVIPDTWDYALFYLDDNDNSRLMYKLDPNLSSNRVAVAKLLSDKVDRLRFSYDNKVLFESDGVIMNATLKQDILGNTKSVSFVSDLKLGNK